MRFPVILLVGMATWHAASGQQAGFSGPVEGFTFDNPTASLRAVEGFPGAASFGPAVLGGLEFASAAPARNYALAVQNGNFLLVSGLGSGSLSTVALPAVTHLPDAVNWSADGSFAVLYSRSGNWLQTVSGLPAAPLAGAYQSLSPLGGQLAAVAVDTSGKQVAIAMSGAQSGLFLITAGQAFAPLLALANPVALSFSTDGTQLYAIDAATRQLAVLSPTSLAVQMTSLDGLADPFAVQPGAGQKIYVASRSDHLLRQYDASGIIAAPDLELSFTPTGIEQFGANSFVVGSRVQPGDPLWLVTNATQPAAYFVPAIPQVIGRGRTETQDSSTPPAPGREGRSR
jgi:hypothetical protein